MPRLRTLRQRTKRDDSLSDAKDEDVKIDKSDTADLSENNSEKIQQPQAKSAKTLSKITKILKAKVYDCKLCKPARKFMTSKNYVIHCKIAHKLSIKEEFKCSSCAFLCFNQQELEMHQKGHQLKRRFLRCSKCSYVTHVRARYTKHVKYHSMPMIKCADCDFRTPYKVMPPPLPPPEFTMIRKIRANLSLLAVTSMATINFESTEFSRD